MSENILSCHHHDYLEAACTFLYKVAVTTDTKVLTGIAKDITTSNKKEWLHLRTDHGTEKVNLMEIIRIEVLTPNAQFKCSIQRSGI